MIVYSTIENKLMKQNLVYLLLLFRINEVWSNRELEPPPYH